MYAPRVLVLTCASYQPPLARRFDIDEELRAAWNTVPLPLQSYAGTFECAYLQSICFPPAHVMTMDGVSKCWECIPANSKKLLVSSIDGEPWCYIGENSGYMSKHIMVSVFDMCLVYACCN